MLIILTLVVTWIAHNWWKLLLLLIAVIILHEYQLKKHPKTADGEAEDGKGEGESSDDVADADEAERAN